MDITGTPGLPLGFTYWYEAENEKEFIIKIKEITDQTAALGWMKQLSLCSFAVWRADKKYRLGYETLFRKHFRCHHHTPPQTRCKASMNIRILRMTAIEEWPCIAQFRGEHNHEVGAPFSISYHPITEDMKNEILHMYQSGYHPQKAYTTYCKDKISLLGLDNWAFFADRYIFPTKIDFKVLWKKHVRDMYLAKVSKGNNFADRNVDLDDSVEREIGEDRDVEEDYFGQRMIDETNDRLDIVSGCDHINTITSHDKGKYFENGEQNSNTNKPIVIMNSNNKIDINFNSNEIEDTPVHTINYTLSNCAMYPSGENNAESANAVNEIEQIIVLPISNGSNFHGVVKKIKPTLNKMSREVLTTFCIKKVIEEISAKKAIADLQKLLQIRDEDILNKQKEIRTLKKSKDKLIQMLNNAAKEQNSNREVSSMQNVNAASFSDIENCSIKGYGFKNVDKSVLLSKNNSKVSINIPSDSQGSNYPTSGEIAVYGKENEESVEVCDDIQTNDSPMLVYVVDCDSIQ